MSENKNNQSQEGVRSLILDAARELFARYGYKKTTMEDIALVLKKGKSSLYYYFKNKEEIFQAVLDYEEDILFSKLGEIVDSDIASKDKFKRYVFCRMETIMGLPNYHQALKDDVFGGYEFVEGVNKNNEKIEVGLLKKMLEEGIEDGSFQVKNAQLAAVAIATSLKGLEVPLFRSSSNFEEFKVQLENVLNILFFGLVKR